MKNQTGIIAAIYRHPVTSMMDEELNTIPVGAKGVEGSRVLTPGRCGNGENRQCMNSSKCKQRKSRCFRFDAIDNGAGNNVNSPALRKAINRGFQSK